MFMALQTLGTAVPGSQTHLMLARFDIKVRVFENGSVRLLGPLPPMSSFLDGAPEHITIPIRTSLSARPPQWNRRHCPYPGTTVDFLEFRPQRLQLLLVPARHRPAILAL